MADPKLSQALACWQACPPDLLVCLLSAEVALCLQ